MKDFYSIEENFNFLYNDIYTLLSGEIVDSSLSENWLANWYICNKYNTTRAIERYAADLIIPRLKYSEIPQDVFKSIIDKKLSGCCESYNDTEYNLQDKLYLIKNIERVKLNESTLSYIIEDFECDDIVSYIEEGFFSEDNIHDNVYESINSSEVLNIISHIKHAVVENSNDREKLEYIKACNESFLYKFKDIITEDKFIEETTEAYHTLEKILNNESDAVIEHTISELKHINELVDYLVTTKLDESSDVFIYNKAIQEFDTLVESIFINNIEEDMDINQLIKLCDITEALCEYESTIEASSRIITKGTEKVTRAVGNMSAKSRGMGSAKSAVAQVKRGGRILDDRVSDAINNKIDQILNFTQEQKREKIITGKNTLRASKILKTILVSYIGAKGVFGIFKNATLLGKVGTVAITLIGLLGARALSKGTEVREKKRIMLDLETELKITREKIEDAKGDNAKEKKYELMRIEARLEKEIFRIKHGLKYY